MSILSNLKPYAGSQKRKIRVGRGENSGRGKTCGRGHKGQKSRSGGSIKPGFEGGQMPLQRRLPKIGFTPLNRVVAKIFSLSEIDKIEGLNELTLEELRKLNLIGKSTTKVKLLGDGEISRAIKVDGLLVSKSAAEKIQKAGGEIVVPEN